MPSEMYRANKANLHSCTKEQCWIPTLLQKDFVALWPLSCDPEATGNNKFYRWWFHVSWSRKRSSKVNAVWLCEKHHKWMLKAMQSEMALDVAEQEATDQWMVRNHGRL